MADNFLEKANFNEVFDAEDMSLESFYGQGLKEIENTINAIDGGITKFSDELSKLNEVILHERESYEDPDNREAEDGGDVVSFPGSNGRLLTGEFGSISLDDRDLVVAGDPNKLLAGGNNSGTPSRMEFGNLNVRW